MQSLADIIRAVAEIVRPPERMTVWEAAARFRKLYNPGAYVGPYLNDMTPYMVEPQDVLTSTDFTGMVFVGPARTGKSDVFFNWLLHTVINDPADMIRYDMTQASSRDWSQGDLARFLRHNPQVREKLSPGRQSDNVHDKHFKNGMRLLIKWPTITELSGKTIPRVWFADYDRIENVENVDGEGPAFDQGRKRTGTYRRYGMTVAESSPGFPVIDPKWISKSMHEAPPVLGGVVSLYNRGDRRRWYWRCDDCGSSYEPAFKLFEYPDTEDIMEAAEQVRLVCPHCGFKIGHEPTETRPGKYQMNLTRAQWIKDGLIWRPDGSIVGTPARSDIASFWMKGPAAGLTDWSSMVANYLRADQEYNKTGNEEPLKSVTGLDLGEPPLLKSMQSSRVPEELKARAKPFELAVVPNGVRFLISCIDVQKSYYDVQVHGIQEYGDIVVVDRFKIRKSLRLDPEGDPYWVSPGSYPEDWLLLVDRVIKKTYPLIDGSGRQMPVKLVMCDSGGEAGVTTQALNFWRWLRLGPQEDAETYGWEPGLVDRFRLLRGTGNRGKPRVHITYPDAHRKDRHSGARGDVPVVEVNSNVLKDALDVMLDRLDPRGGRITFSDKLDDQFFKELAVEVKDEKGNWVNLQKARNESWDLLVYCLAGGLLLRPTVEAIDWEAPPGWAAPWEDNTLVFDPNVKDTVKRSEKIDFAKIAEALA